MKDYGDLAGCYLDLHNSSDDTQPHSIIAKYFRVRDICECFTEFKVQSITRKEAFSNRFQTLN